MDEVARLLLFCLLFFGGLGLLLAFLGIRRWSAGQDAGSKSSKP
jgi:hypothetical protein